MTPNGMRYEDAYANAHPFDKLVERMLQQDMVLETAGLMRKAIESDVETRVLINNRANRWQCAYYRSESGGTV